MKLPYHVLYLLSYGSNIKYDEYFLPVLISNMYICMYELVALQLIKELLSLKPSYRQLRMYTSQSHGAIQYLLAILMVCELVMDDMI